MASIDNLAQAGAILAVSAGAAAAVYVAGIVKRRRDEWPPEPPEPRDRGRHRPDAVEDTGTQWLAQLPRRPLAPVGPPAVDPGPAPADANTTARLTAAHAAHAAEQRALQEQLRGALDQVKAQEAYIAQLQATMPELPTMAELDGMAADAPDAAAVAGQAGTFTALLAESAAHERGAVRLAEAEDYAVQIREDLAAAHARATGRALDPGTVLADLHAAREWERSRRQAVKDNIMAAHTEHQLRRRWLTCSTVAIPVLAVVFGLALAASGPVAGVIAATAGALLIGAVFLVLHYTHERTDRIARMREIRAGLQYAHDGAMVSLVAAESAAMAAGHDIAPTRPPW